jgi:hypothetical protein
MHECLGLGASDRESRHETYRELRLPEEQQESRTRTKLLPPSHEDSFAVEVLENWMKERQWWFPTTIGKCLYVTNSGRFGLALPRALSGDEIWAVLHCPVLMVLRRVDDHFQVVGACILDDPHCSIEKDLLNGLADEEKYSLSEIELR